MMPPCSVLFLPFLLLLLLLAPSSQPQVLKAKPGEPTYFVGAIFDAHDTFLRRVLGRTVDEHNRNVANRGFFLRVVMYTARVNDSARLQIAMCTLLQTHRVIGFIIPGSQHVASHLSRFAQTLQLPVISQNLRLTADHSGAVDVPSGPRKKLLNLATGLNAPWSARRRANSGTNRSFLFTMYPDTHDALAELINFYHMVNFSYVCSSEVGLGRLERLLKAVHHRGDYVDLNVDVRILKNPAFAVEELRRLDVLLDRHRRKNVILDLDTSEETEQVLRQLGQLGMLRGEYHYFLNVINSDRFRVNDFIYSGVNITAFRILNERSGWAEEMAAAPAPGSPEAAIPGGGPPASDDGDAALSAAFMSDAVGALTRAVRMAIAEDELVARLKGGRPPVPTCFYRWQKKARVFAWKNGHQTVAGHWWLGPMLASKLDRLRFMGRTDQVAFDRFGRRDNFTLQVMKLRFREGMRPEGSWNSEKRLVMAGAPIEDNKRSSSTNKTLNVVTLVLPPFIIKKDDPKLKGNDRYEGFCIDMLQAVAERVNFQYRIYEVADNKYGSITGYDANGTAVWNGLMGDVINGTADIAVAPLTINYERAKYVKYTKPFLTFGLSIMIRSGIKKPGIFSFLRPLANSVWICISTACVVVGFGLYIIARISPYEWTILENRVERDFSFVNSIWFAFSAFVQQGVDVAPRSPGARILSSVWWFFTLIMIAYYTANLAAFLTVSRMVKPINDWPDLLTARVEYGTLREGSTRQFFKESPLLLHQSLGHVMEQNERVYVDSVAEGVERVRKSKGKYVFIMESLMNDYYNERQPCNTMMVASRVGDDGYGIAMPLDSPLADDINDAVLTLREEQKLSAMKRKWWVEKGSCSNKESKSDSKALTLINVAGAFYILVAGLGVAMFVALLEFYMVVRKEYRKSKRSFPELMRRKARMSMAGALQGSLELHAPASSNYDCRNFSMGQMPRTINIM